MLAKILNYVKISLVLLSVIVVMLFLSGKIQIESLINFAIFLLIGIISSTVITALINVAENPKTGLRFGIGIGVLVVFYLIGFSLSEEAYHAKTNELIPGSRMAEAGIYTFYFVASSALAVILLSSIKRIKSFL